MEDFDFTNIIGLLPLMKEIQKQQPFSDPDVVVIDRNGKWLF